MTHEKQVLTVLTKARTELMKATTMPEKASVENNVAQALKTIFAVAENYPKLQANESFLHLQTRISDLENQLADRREYYNDSVNNNNIRVESFPDLIIARMCNFKKEEMFKVKEHEKRNIPISIN